MSTLRGWHILPQDFSLQYGDGRVPDIGEWLESPCPPVLCIGGMHASPTALDALCYRTSGWLCRVEVDGVADVGRDKFCGGARRILWAIPLNEFELHALPFMQEFAQQPTVDAGLKIDQRVVDAVCMSFDAAEFEVDLRELSSARDAARASALASAYAFAQDSAWDAAYASAWASARVFAYASARVFAYASAQASAWDSAWDSALVFAYASAQDSAWAFARSSAQDSAWASAWASARGAIAWHCDQIAFDLATELGADFADGYDLETDRES